MSETTIWTLGYEGLVPEDLRDQLVGNGIEILVDVRQRASSRKRGFAKTALNTLATDAGIQYVHLPKLGTPADLRREYQAGKQSLGKYMSAYRRYLTTQTDEVERLRDCATRHRCCLLCYERDPSCCHRSVLADQMGANKIFHLPQTQ